MASSDPNKRPRPGPWPPAPESAAMPPTSWAKKTGFRPKFSGETNASDSGQIGIQQQQSTRRRESDPNLDLEAGRVRPRQEKVNGETTGEKDKPPVRKRRDSDGGGGSSGGGGGVAKSTNGQAVGTTATAEPAAVATTAAAAQQPSRRVSRNEEVVDVLPQVVDDDGFMSRHSHMKYELRDTPGLGEMIFECAVVTVLSHVCCVMLYISRCFRCCYCSHICITFFQTVWHALFNPRVDHIIPSKYLTCGITLRMCMLLLYRLNMLVQWCH